MTGCPLSVRRFPSDCPLYHTERERPERPINSCKTNKIQTIKTPNGAPNARTVTLKEQTPCPHPLNAAKPTGLANNA
jgi:hypothetical protein